MALQVDGVSYLQTSGNTNGGSENQVSETALCFAAELVKLPDSGLAQESQPFETHDEAVGRLIGRAEECSNSGGCTVQTDDLHLKV